MCGNIKKLRFSDRQATDEELLKAAKQFVKKVANYSKPSATNQAVYDRALDDVVNSLRGLLANLSR